MRPLLLRMFSSALIFGLSSNVLHALPLPPNKVSRSEKVLTEVSSVRVENPVGEVRLEESEDDTFRVAADNKGEVPLNLAITTTTTGLGFTVEYPPRAIKAGPVDLVLKVPARVLGDVKIHVANGSAVIPDAFAGAPSAKRSLDVHINNGRFEAKGFIAEAGQTVQIEAGSVEMKAITGDVNVTINAGHVKLGALRGAARVEGQKLDVTIAGVTGDANVDVQVGELVISDAEARVFARNKVGTITFNNPKASSETGKTMVGTVRRTGQSKCDDALGADFPGMPDLSRIFKKGFPFN